MQVIEPTANPASSRDGIRVLEYARLAVHIALIGVFGGALYALYDDNGSLTLHILLGASFFELVIVHLLQRRQTVRRLASTMLRVGAWVKPRGRMAWSDALLTFLIVNVLASGSIDFATGIKTRLPLPGVGMSWHVLSSLLLFGYLLVHVLRRRARLSHSHVR